MIERATTWMLSTPLDAIAVGHSESGGASQRPLGRDRSLHLSRDPRPAPVLLVGAAIVTFSA